MKGFFLLIGVKFLWLILLNISFLRNPYSNYYWTKKQFFRWRAIANLLWVSFAIAIACIILFSSEKFSYQTNVLISVLTFAECTIIAIWTMILEIIAKIQTMKLLRKNIQETIQKNAHITDQKTLLHICQIEYRSSFFTKDIIKIFYAVQKNQKWRGTTD